MLKSCGSRLVACCLLPCLIALIEWPSHVHCLDDATEVTRDYHGDIFTLSANDCRNKSAGCGRGRRFAAAVPGQECKCQCAPSYQVFREDLLECVQEISDCPLASYVRPYITERIPVVSLPTAGQLVHPGAHLTLADIGSEVEPQCEVYSSEVMTQFGWHSLDEEHQVFEVATEGKNNRTFLRWLGGDLMRRELQQRLVLVHFVCTLREGQEQLDFMPCAAMRIGWVPGAALAPSSTHSVSTFRTTPGKGNNNQNYLIIGLSLGILGLMYVMALMIYLRTKKAAQRRKRSDSSVSKSSSSPQTQTSSVERAEEGDFSDGAASLESDKGGTTSGFFNPALIQDDETPRRFYSTADKYSSREQDAERANANQPSDEVTKAAPFSKDPKARNDVSLSSATISAESSRSKRAMQINPALFEPEYLAEPPPPAVEFLKRIRDMIAAARGRIRNFRFKPTLLVIPEDDYFYHDLQMPANNKSPPVSADEGMPPPVPPPRVQRSRRLADTPMVGRKQADPSSQSIYANRSEIFSISDGNHQDERRLASRTAMQSNKSLERNAIGRNQRNSKTNGLRPPATSQSSQNYARNLKEYAIEIPGGPKEVGSWSTDIDKQDGSSKLSRKDIMTRLDDNYLLIDNQLQRSSESDSNLKTVESLYESQSEYEVYSGPQMSMDHSSSSKPKKDQELIVSSTNEEPSEDTLERLSRKVALKLSERKVPGMSQRADDSDGKQPFLQIMKDFKNSIGKIASKQPKPTLNVFANNEGNWKLQSSLEARNAQNRPQSAAENESRNGNSRDEARLQDMESEQGALHCATAPTQGDEEEEPETPNGQSNPQLAPLSTSLSSNLYTRNKVTEKQRKKYQKIARAPTKPIASLSSSTGDFVVDCTSDAESAVSTSLYEIASADTWSISSYEVSTTSSSKQEPGLSSDTISVASDMTQDSLDSYRARCKCGSALDESTMETTDDEDAIEACLARLANATVDSESGAALKIDRATKGLAALQKFKTSSWRHVCRQEGDGEVAKTSLAVKEGRKNAKGAAARSEGSARRASRSDYLSDDNASTVTVSSFAFSKTAGLLDESYTYEQSDTESLPPPVINYASHPTIGRTDESPPGSADTLTSRSSSGSQRPLQRSTPLNAQKKSSNYARKKLPPRVASPLIEDGEIKRAERSEASATDNGGGRAAPVTPVAALLAGLDESERAKRAQLLDSLRATSKKYLKGNCKQFIQRKQGSSDGDDFVSPSSCISASRDVDSLLRDGSLSPKPSSTVIEVTGSKSSQHYVTRIPV